MSEKKRLFISYKRNCVPDETLATQLFNGLKDDHQVFIDREIQVGEKWAARIRDEIAACDYFILLLSPMSIESNMVIEEVRVAEGSRKERKSEFPLVLPIRVAYEGDLPYDLGGMLNHLQYALWHSEADTPKLLSQLVRVISGQNTLPEQGIANRGTLAAEIPFPAANPRAPLEAPEGTMAAHSSYYVERLADRIAADEQIQPAYTLTIMAPRQMGKSSLLGRVMARAGEKGSRIAFMDFQSFGSDVLQDPALFYPQFCFLLEDGLDLPSRYEEFWKLPISAPQRCLRFLERHILPACSAEGLLLAIDEADSLLASPWRSDFFGMLRSWHNLRTTSPAKWAHLSLAMAISTEPTLLIENQSQSPFNVGRTLTLEDFSGAQSTAANRAHGSPLATSDLDSLHTLVGGHPYLLRRALYLLCQGRYSFEQLMRDADSETGPFGDHLRAQLFRLGLRPGIQAALYSILSSRRCDGATRLRLIAGGLIVEREGKPDIRNELYRRYFKRVLHA